MLGVVIVFELSATFWIICKDYFSILFSVGCVWSLMSRRWCEKTAKMIMYNEMGNSVRIKICEFIVFSVNCALCENAQ